MNQTLYARLAESAFLFDLDQGVVELTGPDRVSWLQRMVSNDVVRVNPGGGCYAAYLSSQGKLISQMVVLADNDVVYLLMEKGNVDHTVSELDKLLIMEEVEIQDRSSESSCLSLVGGVAESVLKGLVGVPPGLDSLYSHSIVGGARIVRTELGYLFLVPRAQCSSVRAQLVSSGAESVDPSLFNTVRVEAGLPIYGRDIDQTTTLPELGEKGIDYDKGCYVGQEVVAKIKYIGHVNRRFVGLALSGSDLPPSKSPVMRAEKEVGYVTSAVHSPALNSPIALAFVRFGSDKEGTEVEVLIDESPRPATIVSLPFVKHDWLASASG